MNAATFLVPEDYPTIQAAIDASHSGDEVVVSTGTYIQSDPIRLDSSIVLRSTFDGNNWELIKNTIIKSFGGAEYISISSTPITIRGFTMTRDPTTPFPGQTVVKQGINGPTTNATIEYNIIENCVALGGNTGFKFSGATLIGITGIIQNNIIRNSRADSASAMGACGGVIRNNVIVNITDAPLALEVGGRFVNNTVYSTSTVGVSIFGESTNNIFWCNASVGYSSSVNPRHCLIRGYTGPCESNLNADPDFTDRANGDFHLQSTSPCIDAGTPTLDVTADIEGVQRGLKINQSLTGPGPFYDIGAYEFRPFPVAVWLANGGPATIHAGDVLNVAWQMDVPTAGTTINLQLYDDRSFVSGFGPFFSATGIGQSQISLPASLPTKTTYYVKGTSASDLRLAAMTPLMTILTTFNAVPEPWWAGYR